MAEQKPVLNDAGTHVFMAHPENGIEWECPVDAVDFYRGRGFAFVEPRDKSWDGLYDLYDPAVAEAKVAEAKKAAKSSGA